VKRRLLLLASWLLLGACHPTEPTADSLAIAGHPVPPDQIRSYLAASIGISAFGGEVFCAYEPLDARQGQQGRLYLWALCQEYFVEDGELRAGSGVSLPVVLFVQEANDRLAIVRHRMPRDGAAYGSDVRSLFPASVWDQVMPQGKDEILAYNGRSERLERETETQARALLSEGSD
jgi:hypothetical protein